MKISKFQKLIEEIYFNKDSKRGREATFIWLSEEIGELARAIRHSEEAKLKEEFADVLAWLASLASLYGIDLEKEVAAKYGKGCPKCHRSPCECLE